MVGLAGNPFISTGDSRQGIMSLCRSLRMLRLTHSVTQQFIEERSGRSSEKFGDHVKTALGSPSHSYIIGSPWPPPRCPWHQSRDLSKNPMLSQYNPLKFRFSWRDRGEVRVRPKRANLTESAKGSGVFAPCPARDQDRGLEKISGDVKTGLTDTHIRSVRQRWTLPLGVRLFPLLQNEHNQFSARFRLAGYRPLVPSRKGQSRVSHGTWARLNSQS